MSDLTKSFNEAMYNIYRQAISETSYRPTAFLQMLERIGGLATAKQLLNSTKPSDGYTKLHEIQRLDLSVEAVILENPQWHPLFSPEELSRIERRLKDYNYKPRFSKP